MSTFVAINKDGTEIISNGALMRRKYNGRRVLSAMWGMCTGHYSKNNWNKWYNGWSTDENDFLPFYGATLPKGSIKKLIGHELTWKDEPVKLKAE